MPFGRNQPALTFVSVITFHLHNGRRAALHVGQTKNVRQSQNYCNGQRYAIWTATRVPNYVKIHCDKVWHEKWAYLSLFLEEEEFKEPQNTKLWILLSVSEFNVQFSTLLFGTGCREYVYPLKMKKTYGSVDEGVGGGEGQNSRGSGGEVGVKGVTGAGSEGGVRSTGI